MQANKAIILYNTKAKRFEVVAGGKVQVFTRNYSLALAAVKGE